MSNPSPVIVETTTLEEKQRYCVDVYRQYLQRLPIKELKKCKASSIGLLFSFGLSYEDRTAIWQKEYDRRTLLRAAEFCISTVPTELLRAS